MSNINIVSSASISGTYQFFAQRGGGDKDGERVRKRGEKKEKARDGDVFICFQFEFIVCEFAVVDNVKVEHANCAFSVFCILEHHL